MVRGESRALAGPSALTETLARAGPPSGLRLGATVGRSAALRRSGGPGEETLVGEVEGGGGGGGAGGEGAEHPRIGRYAVLRKLGEGGMGAVYAAYDEELDRRVAIKLVREHLAGDTLGRARMQREAQALARVSHPNVVQVYDVGGHGDQVFIAMEHVRGVTLREWQAAIDAGSPAGRAALIDMYVQAGRGLAAAHAAGLVHRDFKPDNVLVGDDGRARVLDFGIAASRGAAPPVRARAEGPADALASTAVLDALSRELTGAGAVIGTPAYMAPEQFLAQPSDARTDQFSFCVALYAALYGEEPFGGDSFVARQVAVTSGEVAPPPPGARVPAWLRAVVVRGLALRPEDRHPSMEALLAALVADPEVARRRRLRGAGLIAAVAAVSAILVYAALVGWGAWQRRRAEADAGERLAAMEASAAEQAADGDVAEAERLFEAFVRHPAHRGTEALALAWLGRAAREAAAGRRAAAVDAYAASYAVATSREHQVAALGALVRFFDERLRWSGLIRAVATLEGRAADAFVAEDLAAARLRAATARRDLDAALQLVDAAAPSPGQASLRRLVAALAPARRTSLDSGVGFIAAAPGAGDEVAVAVAGGLHRRRADLDLSPLTEHRLGVVVAHQLAPPRAGLGAGPLYLGHDAVAGEAALLGVVGESLVELHRWTDHAPRAVLVQDLDGDGVGEVLVGTGPYTRHVVELVPPGAGEGPGGWSTRAAAPMLDARRSDVSSLIAGDLDGDGEVEVIAGLGAWRAYEIQALRRRAGAAHLETAARLKLGNVSVALRRRPGGPPQVAAWKCNESHNPTVFPPDRPQGAADGLHWVELVEGRLEVVASLPVPGGVHVSGVLPFTGDLDGDGRDEVIVEWRDEEGASTRRSTLIVTDSPGGGLTALPIAESWPLAVHDLDGDGDDEVILELSDGGGVWALGGGDGRLPALAEAAPAAPRPAPALDVDSARIWRHAEDLAAMGLEAQAAEAFAGLADGLVATRPGPAGQALLRAAALHDGLGDDARAAALYARAAALDGLAEEAGMAAVRAYRRRGDLAGARALIDEVLARGGLSATGAAALAAARARAASDDARVDLDFAAPLDPRWKIHRPLTLIRDAPSSALRVDATGDGVIAALPGRWSGGAVALEVVVDLRRAEWGEFLAIELGREGGGPAVGVGAGAFGGTGDQFYALRCQVGDLRLERFVPFDLARPLPPGRHRLRVVLDPEAGELSCAVEGPSGEEIHYVRQRLPVLPDLAAIDEVRLTSAGPAQSKGWIAADISRITLRGVALGAGGPAPPLSGARHSLVEGRLADALAALGPAEVEAAGLAPSTRALVGFWRIHALTGLSRWEEAVRELRVLLDEPALAEAIDGPLTHLLRVAPEAAAALLRAAGPAGRHRTRLVETWSLAAKMRPRDPLPLRVLYRGLLDLEEEEGAPEALAELYALRAMVHGDLGMAGRSRRDYAAALALLERAPAPVDAAEAAARHHSRLAWGLAGATQALRDGDREAARAALDLLLADPADEAFVRDALDADPALAAAAGG